MENVIIKERPKAITPDQKEAYISEFAQEIKDEGFTNSPIKFIKEDLENQDINDDGYSIAKKLESNGKGIYKFNSMFVEFLDSFSDGINDIIKENVKKWVKENNIKPKFNNKQRLKVITKLSFDLPTDSIIYIYLVNEEHAYYVINQDINDEGGYVISYEKIEANCELLKSFKDNHVTPAK